LTKLDSKLESYQDETIISRAEVVQLRQLVSENYDKTAMLEEMSQDNRCIHYYLFVCLGKMTNFYLTSKNLTGIALTNTIFLYKVDHNKKHQLSNTTCPITTQVCANNCFCHVFLVIYKRFQHFCISLKLHTSVEPKYFKKISIEKNVLKF
jgi:hypothetical protein